jgi:hypothetical protein
MPTRIPIFCTALTLLALGGAAIPTKAHATKWIVGQNGRPGAAATRTNVRVGGLSFVANTGKVGSIAPTKQALTFTQAAPSAAQKCLAFQRQVKICEAAMGGGGEGVIPRGCAAVLQKSISHPCG